MNVNVNVNGEEIELPEDIEKQLTLDNIHFMYCTHNFADIIINDEGTICVTPEQLEDMWAGFFGVYAPNSSTGKFEYIEELSPQSRPNTKDEMQNRLASFKFMLGDFARKIFPVEKFKSEIVRDRDLLEFGLELCMDAMTTVPTVAEFVSFRERLIDKMIKRSAKK